MNQINRRGQVVALAAMLLLAVGKTDADDDDTAPVANAGAALPALNLSQQQAAEIRVARPLAAAPPLLEQALGEVLDPQRFISDSTLVDATEAAALAVDAEVKRLRALYRAGASASLKALQAAAARQAQTQAELSTARSRLALRWGALAKDSAKQRQRLIAALIAGRIALIRADLPGHHSLGRLPQRARVDVDGVQWPARVLGVSPQGGAALASAALLLEVDHPPPGLASGARLPVRLEGAPQSGFVIPAAALLYDEHGSYVYLELAGKTGDGRTRFAPKTVELLQPVGHSWLVRGLNADERVVVHGAGVLWSLQGLGSVEAEDED
ncbi:MAG: hypothetical protein KGJ55_05100 [Gammaproteobacteria bacterium]|nr:hypothetical protein [Gammaproteobacteria bacterium]